MNDLTILFAIAVIVGLFLYIVWFPGGWISTKKRKGPRE